MNITFSPSRSDNTLTLIREGNTLIVNGESLDFSFIAGGNLLPADAITNDWIVGDVERQGGELQITILRPHGRDADEADRFPEPITLADGETLTFDPTPPADPEPEPENYDAV